MSEQDSGVEFSEEDARQVEEDELVECDESINYAEERELEGGDDDDYDEEDPHGARPISEPDEDDE
jgi:hypothetical protein